MAAAQQNQNVPPQFKVRMANPYNLSDERVSPATLLLEKRREMFEVQAALDAQKEDFERLQTEFDRREAELKKRDTELKESLVRFNKFLQENEHKRQRAEKKAQEEIKMRKKKEAELATLREELKTKQREGQRIFNQYNRHLRYQRFLERTAEASDEFQEIRDVLRKYDTLKATNEDLTATSEKAEGDAERVQTELQKYTRKKQNEMLQLNNEISRQQQRLENAEGRSRETQTVLERSHEDAMSTTLLLGELRLACENIFERAVNSSTIVRPATTILPEQLSFIADFFQDLQHIMRGYQTAKAMGLGLDELSEALAQRERSQIASVGLSGCAVTQLCNRSSVVDCLRDHMSFEKAKTWLNSELHDALTRNVPPSTLPERGLSLAHIFGAERTMGFLRVADLKQILGVFTGFRALYGRRFGREIYELSLTKSGVKVDLIDRCVKFYAFVMTSQADNAPAAPSQAGRTPVYASGQWRQYSTPPPVNRGLESVESAVLSSHCVDCRNQSITQIAPFQLPADPFDGPAGLLFVAALPLDEPSYSEALKSFVFSIPADLKKHKAICMVQLNEAFKRVRWDVRTRMRFNNSFVVFAEEECAAAPRGIAKKKPEAQIPAAFNATPFLVPGLGSASGAIQQVSLMGSIAPGARWVAVYACEGRDASALAQEIMAVREHLPDEKPKQKEDDDDEFRTSRVWICPLCKKLLKYADLRVDDHIACKCGTHSARCSGVSRHTVRCCDICDVAQDGTLPGALRLPAGLPAILQKTGPEVDEVVIDGATGEWTLKEQPKGANKRKRSPSPFEEARERSRSRPALRPAAADYPVLSAPTFVTGSATAIPAVVGPGAYAHRAASGAARYGNGGASAVSPYTLTGNAPGAFTIGSMSQVEPPSANAVGDYGGYRTWGGLPGGTARTPAGLVVGGGAVPEIGGDGRMGFGDMSGYSSRASGSRGSTSQATALGGEQPNLYIIPPRRDTARGYGNAAPEATLHRLAVQAAQQSRTNGPLVGVSSQPAPPPGHHGMLATATPVGQAEHAYSAVPRRPGSGTRGRQPEVVGRQSRAAVGKAPPPGAEGSRQRPITLD